MPMKTVGSETEEVSMNVLSLNLVNAGWRDKSPAPKILFEVEEHSAARALAKGRDPGLKDLLTLSRAARLGWFHPRL